MGDDTLGKIERKNRPAVSPIEEWERRIAPRLDVVYFRHVQIPSAWVTGSRAKPPVRMAARRGSHF